MEGEAGDLPFFPTLAAYVLTLHDAHTKVEDCRRTAVSKDIGGGMCRCDSNASVTPSPSNPSIFDHLIFLLSPSTATKARGE